MVQATKTLLLEIKVALKCKMEATTHKVDEYYRVVYRKVLI